MLARFRILTAVGQAAIVSMSHPKKPRLSWILVVALVLDLCTLLAIDAFPASKEAENENDDYKDEDDRGVPCTALTVRYVKKCDK